MKRAMCDTSTKKIYNCEKGSFEWFHEKAHLIFSDDFAYLLLIQQYIFDMFNGLLILGFLFLFISPTFAFVLGILSFACFIIYQGINMFEEVSCNKYANSKIS